MAWGLVRTGFFGNDVGVNCAVENPPTPFGVGGLNKGPPNAAL